MNDKNKKGPQPESVSVESSNDGDEPDSRRGDLMDAERQPQVKELLSVERRFFVSIAETRVSSETCVRTECITDICACVAITTILPILVFCQSTIR